MTTGILVLAAGFSRRFGNDKRRAQLADGRSLLIASIEAAQASGLPVRVCLRPGDAALAAQVEQTGVVIIYCQNAHRGMGATLAEGVNQCADWDALLVALGDMPHIRSDSYRRVAHALAEAPICRPVYRGESGHPVGFTSSLFPELQGLQGDAGARSVIQRHAGKVRSIALDDPGIVYDVDFPANLD